MRLRFKCKNCNHIYTIDPSASEYFLPAKCPACSYRYQNDTALRLFLADIKHRMDAEKNNNRS